MRAFTIYDPNQQKSVGTINAKRIEVDEEGILKFFSESNDLIGVTQVSPSLIIYDASISPAGVLLPMPLPTPQVGKDECTK